MIKASFRGLLKAELHECTHTTTTMLDRGKITSMSLRKLPKAKKELHQSCARRLAQFRSVNGWCIRWLSITNLLAKRSVSLTRLSVGIEGWKCG